LQFDESRTLTREQALRVDQQHFLPFRLLRGETSIASRRCRAIRPPVEYSPANLGKPEAHPRKSCFFANKGLAILSSLRAITIDRNHLYPFSRSEGGVSFEQRKRTPADDHSG
jgi:hypothetical protein